VYLVSIIIEFNKNLISNFASHKMSIMDFKKHTLKHKSLNKYYLINIYKSYLKLSS
jgi:hypothetical protein